MVILSVDACLYMYLEVDTYRCSSKRSILFFFTLYSTLTLLEYLNIKSFHMHIQYLHVYTGDIPAPVAQSVESPLRNLEITGSIPGRDIPKFLKNGPSCSSLSTQTYVEKIGLVEAVSG